VKSENKKERYWVDLQDMDNMEVSELAFLFDIHPLTVEDCILQDTREKEQAIQNYVFVVINEMSYKENTNIVVNRKVAAIVFDHAIITIHKGPVACVPDALHKLDRLYNGKFSSTNLILHGLLDVIVDGYEHFIDQVMYEVDPLDGMVLFATGAEQGELLTRINFASKRIHFLAEGLIAKRDIVAGLIRNDTFITKTTRIYFKNVYDQVLRMQQKLTLTRNLVSNISAVNNARVSVQLSAQSNETSEVAKLLGIVGAIFLPLNLLAGIGGMNVNIPGMITDSEEYPTWGSTYDFFIGIMLLMGSIAAVMLLVFFRLKWF